MTRINIAPRKRYVVHILILLAVSFFCFFWKLGYNEVFDLDEALYANCAREMALNGDFITPHINGVPFYEKPPLVYWMGALNYRLLGRNPWTTRLPSAFLSLLMTLMIYYFGRSRMSEQTGFLAGLMYALNPLVVGEAHQLTTDATVAFCIAAAIICFHMALSTRRKPLWYYGFWVFCALGVLAKGAPGIVFPVLIAYIYIYWIKQKRLSAPLAELKRPRLYVGFMLFLVIAAPWHIAALVIDGRPFWEMYIIRQHLGRFYGLDKAHHAPIWFYLPGLLLGFMPWSFYLGQAYFLREEPSVDIENRNFRLFLRIWIAVIFIVFSMSGSKLVSYILPLYPAAALLTSDFLIRAMKTDRYRLPLTIGAICFFIFSLALFLPIAFIHPIIATINHRLSHPIHLSSVPSEVFPWIAHLTIALAAGSGAAVGCILIKRTRWILYSTLACIVAFLAIALGEGLPIIKNEMQLPLLSLVKKIDTLNPRPTSVLIATGAPRRPSILFYLPDVYFIAQSPKRYQVAEKDRIAGNPYWSLLLPHTRQNGKNSRGRWK
jgi:4-amino-4-deoxy-L-arabinose transferase-like glycosyltransferase